MCATICILEARVLEWVETTLNITWGSTRMMTVFAFVVMRVVRITSLVLGYHVIKKSVSLHSRGHYLLSPNHCRMLNNSPFCLQDTKSTLKFFYLGFSFNRKYRLCLWVVLWFGLGWHILGICYLASSTPYDKHYCKHQTNKEQYYHICS